MYLHRNKKGVVYIAYNKAIKGMVKIGVSQNCYKNRVKNLNNQSVPFPFEILAAFETDKSLEFEQYVHENLSKKLVAKEFFKLGKDESVRLVFILASTFQHKVTML